MDHSRRALFISYASQDAEIAKRIVDSLCAAGLEVWIDQSELRGGDAWDAAIRARIKDCALFIPVISASTESRGEGYFRLEWKLAADRSQLMADDQAFLLPVVIDATPEASARVPEAFRARHWVRLPGGEPTAQFVSQVKRLLEQVHATAEPAAPVEFPHRAGAGSRQPVRLVVGIGIAMLVAVLLANFLATKELATGAGQSAPGLPPGSVAAATASAKAAIAILPLRSEGDDATRDYFAEGLTQDLITAMGRFPELTVMSWNAVYPYRGAPAPPSRVASELSVQYQVEGSVLQSAGRIRVNARLIDAQGRVHWSDRFDERLTDLFALQDRMTREIAGALAVNVSRIEEKRAASKTERPEAYDFVLRARSNMHRPTRAGSVEARELLRRAIELDPASAPAHAALADTYLVPVVMGWAESPAQSLTRAEEMAHKALALDENLSRAHVALGRIHLLHHRYAEADAALRRALAINPSDAHALAGRGNVLMWMGEKRAAIDMLEQAQRIDPAVTAIDRIALGLAYYLDGRYDRAVEQLEVSLRSGTGTNPTRVVLAAAYARQGRAEDAVRTAADVRRLDPTFEPMAFGSKLRNPAQLEELRVGLRKAGLL